MEGARRVVSGMQYRLRAGAVLLAAKSSNVASRVAAGGGMIDAAAVAAAATMAAPMVTTTDNGRQSLGPTAGRMFAGGAGESTAAAACSSINGTRSRRSLNIKPPRPPRKPHSKKENPMAGVIGRYGACASGRALVRRRRIPPWHPSFAQRESSAASEPRPRRPLARGPDLAHFVGKGCSARELALDDHDGGSDSSSQSVDKLRAFAQHAMELEAVTAAAVAAAAAAAQTSAAAAMHAGGHLLRSAPAAEALQRTQFVPSPSLPLQPDPRLRADSMLRDGFGRFHNYLRISLTERCNLRCVYCMPEDGVPLQPAERLLSSEEIARVTAMFAAAGVDKVRLTGGEPLLRKDLPDIVGAIRANPAVRNVGITTNGMLLERRLPELQQAGLTHINVSVDTLDPAKFSRITRRPPGGLGRALGAIEAALAAGYGGDGGGSSSSDGANGGSTRDRDRSSDGGGGGSSVPGGSSDVSSSDGGGGGGGGGRLKVNCVVMGGVNDEELGDFLRLGETAAVDVRFIEWMPFDDNRWNDASFVSFKDMLSIVRRSHPMLARVADGDNDTTKWFQVPGHKGRVGFITSMSQHFCGSCNRLRVTADGNLKVCLFGDESLSLRDAMRGGLSDAEVGALVRVAVQGKKFALGGHGDMYGIAQSRNRPMITIGG